MDAPSKLFTQKEQGKEMHEPMTGKGRWCQQVKTRRGRQEEGDKGKERREGRVEPGLTGGRLKLDKKQALLLFSSFTYLLFSLM